MACIHYECKLQVRMLGSGRPFLLEIQNSRILPSKVSVKEMEEKINSLGGKSVKVTAHNASSYCLV